MSRVVVLVGSVRRGGNTDVLARRFAEGARENNDVEIISVADVKVNPCRGCNACFSTEGNLCVQKDDMSWIYGKLAEADVLVMTAAVADFRPARAARRKIHKGAMPDSIRLVPNPDILATLARRKGRRVFIGFAAETERAVAGAARKLRAKGLDLVVANDVTLPGAGFGTDTNIVSLVRPDGSAETLPVLPKLDVARRIVAEAESLFAGRRA